MRTVENNAIKKVTNQGLILNLLLAVIKVVAGVLGNSTALVADGVHTVSDMATDVAVLLGVHFGSKEADQKHPYGHGRIETFSAAGISIILIAVGLGMLYKAAININDAMEKPGGFVIAVAAFSILAKEWMYRVTRKIAMRTNSPALYANAWHHRSDALSSVAVLVGLISMLFGFKYGDHIATMVVGMMISFVGWRVLVGCIQELAEGAVDADMVRQISSVIEANKDVRQWHKLRTRMVGREVFLDVHILVDATLDISSAHAISERIEDVLYQELSRPINIVIHIEPDEPEFRK
jgi:cation diffusion facilitator family transporter